MELSVPKVAPPRPAPPASAVDRVQAGSFGLGRDVASYIHGCPGSTGCWPEVLGRYRPEPEEDAPSPDLER